MKLLPSEFSHWIDIAQWSNLKHPKTWMRNKRLRKKFNKNYKKYLSEKIWSRYRVTTLLEIYQNELIERTYQKAMEQIRREEDKLWDIITKQS